MKKIIIYFNILIAVLVLSACQQEREVKKDFNIRELRKIEELTTLECGFNNVATVNQKKGKGIFNVGEKDRKMFIEYEGIAKYGINMADIKYDIDEKIITLPKAKLLSIHDDIHSYSEVISADGLINKNKIDEDKIKNSITDSLNKMKTYMENNQKMLEKAQLLALDYVKNYVKIVGGDKSISIIYEK